jgi:hypothetical protein
MKLGGIIFLLLLLACPSQIVAHEALLTAYCRQGICLHTLVKNIEPIQIRKNGILRRYESSFVERKCKVNEGMDDAECWKVHPALDAFKNFSRSYAFCSLSNPATFSALANSPNAYVGTFLNVAGTVPQYQVAATLEYLVVCHGWEPLKFDDEFAKNAAALGYKPIASVSSQVKLESESDILSFLDNGSKGDPPSPSLQNLEGKWYSGGAEVCKGSPGETEGLLTFNGTHLVGLESDCAIRNSKANGSFLAIQMVCNGEGMQSRVSELIQFMNQREIKRTVLDGRNRYTSRYVRCASNSADTASVTIAGTQERSEPAATLIELWYDANSRCRGGRGDSPLTDAACSERERYDARLDALNRCYGKRGQIGAEMKWHMCSSDSIRDTRPHN